MKFNDFINNYLEASNESVGVFAKRAGVNRSTVYRAKAGSDHLLFHLVEGMVRAAGGEFKIIKSKAPATPRGGEDAA